MRRTLWLSLLLLCFRIAYAEQDVSHQQSIRSAPLEIRGGFGVAGVDSFVYFNMPMVVGVHSNILYFYDYGKQLIYRYNISAQSLTPLVSVTNHLAGVPSAITVDTDGSFFIADPFARQVLHFNMSGDLLRRYASMQNLNNPVSMVRSLGSKLLVADRLYGHVVVFNLAGQPLYAFGERGTGHAQFLEIVDMARGPDGIYVLDRLVKQVMVFNEEGRLIRVMPRTEVNDPTAITVDYAERVYISDASDDTIKVYDRRGLRSSFGGTGGADGQFRMVSDMHADGSHLYVADSANNRIQIFMLEAAFARDLGPALPADDEQPVVEHDEAPVEEIAP